MIRTKDRSIRYNLNHLKDIWCIFIDQKLHPCDKESEKLFSIRFTFEVFPRFKALIL